jgi:hypothetical protein
MPVEWILVVWLIVAGPEGPVLAPAFEVGTYRMLDGEHGCNRAARSVSFERSDVEFIALCVERDKQ